MIIYFLLRHLLLCVVQWPTEDEARLPNLSRSSCGWKCHWAGSESIILGMARLSCSLTGDLLPNDASRESLVKTGRFWMSLATQTGANGPFIHIYRYGYVACAIIVLIVDCICVLNTIRMSISNIYMTISLSLTLRLKLVQIMVRSHAYLSVWICCMRHSCAHC